MKIHLALLRGINVSGQKLIKMEELRKTMTDAGFENVTTYIQSGNIIFESAESSQEKVGSQIKKIILENYGWDVGVLMLSKKDLEKIVCENPFLETGVDRKQLYVAFLSEIPKEENLENFSAANIGNDVAILSGKVLYLKYAIGAGNSKLSNALIERKLKVTSTMRNWNTTQKLLDLLG